MAAILLSFHNMKFCYINDTPYKYIENIFYTLKYNAYICISYVQNFYICVYNVYKHTL